MLYYVTKKLKKNVPFIIDSYIRGKKRRNGHQVLRFREQHNKYGALQPDRSSLVRSLNIRHSHLLLLRYKGRHGLRSRLQETGQDDFEIKRQKN